MLLTTVSAKSVQQLFLEIKTKHELTQSSIQAFCSSLLDLSQNVMTSPRFDEVTKFCAKSSEQEEKASVLG